MAKRLICVIISVLMIVSLLPTGAFATEDTPVATAAEVTETEEKSEESEGQQTETVELTATEEASQTDAGLALSETLASGSYTVTGSETLTSITVPSEVTATIDLAGNTLSANITVSGGSLEIKDSTTTETSNVAGSGGTVSGSITISSGEVTINGGNYTSLSGTTGSKAATINYGTFTTKITGGVIGDTVDGDFNVYSNADGTFFYTTTMYHFSVTISDTTTYYNTDFSSALTAANVENTTATLTVLDNQAAASRTSVSITGSGIDVAGNLTIDFNKCSTVSVSVTSEYIFKVSSGTALTLLNNEDSESALGSSSATSTSNGGIAVYVNGGTLNVGDYASIKGYYGIKVDNGGIVNVNGTAAQVTGSDTAIYVESGSVTLSGSGVISAGTYGVYLADSSCSFTLSGSGSIDSDNYGVYSNGATVSVTGSGTISGDNYGVYSVGGSVSMTSGGTITGTATDSVGIYASDGCTVTMSAGTVEAKKYGIQVVNSTLTLNGNISHIQGASAGIYAGGSTVTITGLTDSSEISNGGGSDGYCVYAVNGSTINIDSGWFSGNSTACLYSDSDSSITVSGGLYSSDVSNYCLSGYTTSGDETGYSIVEDSSATFYAQNTNTGTKYTSLSAAITAAGSGNTIQLLDEVTETVTIPANANIVLDLAGFTLTGNVTITAGGALTIEDSTESTGTLDGDITVKGTYEEGWADETESEWVVTVTAATFELQSGTIKGDVTVKFSNMTMSGGTISGGRVILVGEVIVSDGIGSTLEMSGGTITGNTETISNYTYAYGGAGVLVGQYCTFTMSAGTITGNTTNGVGGGVHVDYSGTFIMSGGTISNNSAFAGGGVFLVGEGSTFTMSGDAVITGNSSDSIESGAGGVYVGSGASFTMNGGTISNNSTELEDDYYNSEEDGYYYICRSHVYSGGGVNVVGGTFTMNDGTITGNSANHGGGVSVGGWYERSGEYCGGTFIMNGGTISGNTALHEGGGVYLYDLASGVNSSNVTFSVSGSATISDNIAQITDETVGSYGLGDRTTDAVTNNVYLPDGYYITLSDALTGTIGVTTETAPTDDTSVQITAIESGTTYYSSSVNYIVSDDDSYMTQTNEGKYVELVVVAFTLGISTDNSTKVEAEIASGDGTSELYVKVSADSISANYSESAYPTTTLTYTETDFDTEETTTHSYIFAGWYTSEDGETFTPCSSSMWDDISNSSTDYYAKFVDANVLYVMGQLPANATLSYDTMKIRFVSTVDSLDYSSVGFKFTVGSNTLSSSSSSVYQTITGADENDVFSYLPSSFSSKSLYFITCTLTNIPSSGFDTGIVVQATWTTLDGTTVYGAEREFKVNDMLTSSSNS